MISGNGENMLMDQKYISLLPHAHKIFIYGSPFSARAQLRTQFDTVSGKSQSYSIPDQLLEDRHMIRHGEDVIM